jgi:multidrug efflux pump
VSGAVSLTMTPMLCSRLLRHESPAEQRGWFYRVTEKVFSGLLNFYSFSLRWVLRHAALMLLVTITTLCLTIWLYRIVPKGFFPQQDTGLIFGNTEGAQDISFDAMVQKQNLITKIIQNDPAVETVTSAVGSGGGGSTNQGRVFIALKPRSQRKDDATQVVARLRRKTASITGIGCFLQAAQDIRVGGRATKGQYIYSLVSPDEKELDNYVPKLLAELQKSKILKDLTTDQQDKGLQSSVVIDRVKASELGIQPQQVDSALYSAFGQRQVSVIYTERDQFHVVLEATPKYLLDPSSLDKIYVSGAHGVVVPLSAIASFQTTNTPTIINHQGQFPAVTFSFNLDQGTSLDTATKAIDDAARKINLPADVRGSFQGTAQVFTDSLSSEPILILTAIIAVYIVLGVLYESFIHPITILSTLPSAGLGALLALLLFQIDLSIVAIIGIILLIGIVKKNAIMMVDFALEAERKDELAPEQAIYEACVTRFRPIIMTTLAAAFGAVPLAIGHGDGAEIRQPLGVAIIGGLIVSQVLTLYTTPIIYLYLDRIRRAIRQPALPRPALATR